VTKDLQQDLVATCAEVSAFTVRHILNACGFHARTPRCTPLLSLTQNIIYLICCLFGQVSLEKEVLNLNEIIWLNTFLKRRLQHKTYSTQYLHFDYNCK